MSKNTHIARLARPTALIIGVLIIGVFVFVAAGEVDIIDAGVTKRAVAMIFGALLIVTGNLLPKIVRPLNAQFRNPTRTMTAERFAGWTFVLAGIAYIAVWALAPQKYAMLISSAVGLGAFVLVAGAWVWLTRGARSRNQHETK